MVNHDINASSSVIKIITLFHYERAQHLISSLTEFSIFSSIFRYITALIQMPPIQMELSVLLVAPISC